MVRAVPKYQIPVPETNKSFLYPKIDMENSIFEE